LSCRVKIRSTKWYQCFINCLIIQCNKRVRPDSRYSCCIHLRIKWPSYSNGPHGHPELIDPLNRYGKIYNPSSVDTAVHSIRDVSLQSFLAHLCKTLIPSYTIWMLAGDVGSSKVLQLLILPLVGWTCYACTLGSATVVLVDELMAALVPDFALLSAHLGVWRLLDCLS
jgi:hypothetical protein